MPNGLRRSAFFRLLMLTLTLMFAFSWHVVDAQTAELTQDDITRIARSVVYIESVVGRFVDSTGTGTVVTPDGRIYTNRHVAEGADDFRIYLQSEVGELPVFSYYASLVELYDEIDFAVLQIDRDENGQPVEPSTLDLTYLDDFNDTATLGERVYIFGFPAIGDGYLVVTQGAITSVENGTLYGERQPLWYRTDAEISPGNSGGLAVNASGQFIGIPTEVRKEERTLGRLGGVLPYHAVRTVLENSTATGTGDDGDVVTTPTITLTNISLTESICEVYISPISSTTWGRNWLRNTTLLPSDSISWRIESGRYDMLIRDCEQVELADLRALEIVDTLSVTYPESDADLTLLPTPEATVPPFEDDRDGLYIELLDIEHNVTVNDRSETGMKIYTYIRATGYRGEPIRVGIFFFWEDDAPISGENAPISDRTVDGELTTQAVLTPAYSDTEWERYWFWMPYSAFPNGYSGEQYGYAQAYIGTESDEFLGNPSNVIEFTIIYPD